VEVPTWSSFPRNLFIELTFEHSYSCSCSCSSSSSSCFGSRRLCRHRGEPLFKVRNHNGDNYDFET
jgi:hypothetical protein